MDQFYIITNECKDTDMETTNYIRSYLEKREKKMAFNIEDAHCILVLGGDGTLLQAARNTLHLDIPLLGINLGGLGYMAEVEKGNLEEALDILVAGNYEIEEQMMLSGSVRKRDGTMLSGYALNDIVLTRKRMLKVVSYDIYVNGQFLNSYMADGVIVATPTGSTGYNLSVGGPIVEPKASLMVITPICPHTLNTRSVILSPEDQVEVRISYGKNGEEQEVVVYFDGQGEDLHTGDSIFITQRDKRMKFIRLNQVSFLEVLHKKMSEK